MPGSAERKIKLNKALGRSIAHLIRWVARTSEIVNEPPNLQQKLRESHPVILAGWHGQFMMMPILDHSGLKVSAMVARHTDAELIGEAMRQFDTDLIRGAGAGGRKKDRGGMRALRESVRALKSNTSLVMTADVPPGPARVAGLGIITIARLSGRPIVPVAPATSRFKALKTWSRVTINLPYSKLAFVGGEPIFVPPDASDGLMETLRQKLQDDLNVATARAYEIVGSDVKRIEPPKEGREKNSSAAAAKGAGRMSLKIYRAGTRALKPIAPLIVGVRASRGKEEGRRRDERYGRASLARPQGTLVWFHAASVGETNAVLPVIEGIGRARPDVKFLLTTGTVTSASLAARRLGDNALHQYIPLDVPQFVGEFLDHWRPDIAVFTESEIWPNLITDVAARDVPMALVNGRMSERSFKRWVRRPALANPLFGAFDLVLAQNEQIATWFSELGAPRVEAVGNLKIDAPAPPVDKVKLAELSQALGNRPILVAASTHEGEEDIVCEAHRALARAAGDFCTIIVPRHPERGTEIAEAAKGKGFSVAQRSANVLPDARTDIYIADTLGELGTLYALAPVAFIGGSLVEKGGQNPIEAVRRDACVITGPHWFNFTDTYRILLSKEASVEINSAAQLADAVVKLYSDEQVNTRMREAASQALSSMAGALDHTVDALLEIIPGEEELRRAS